MFFFSPLNMKVVPRTVSNYIQVTILLLLRQLLYIQLRRIVKLNL